MAAVTNITREQLIENCKRGIVKESLWEDRDTANAQMQLGVAYALLNAGCEYSFLDDWPFTDTIYIQIRYKGFGYFDYSGTLDKENFYIPTEEKLNKVDGRDWYRQS